MIELVVTINDEFSPHLGVLLQSIVEHNKGTRITCYVVSTYISSENETKLKRVVKGSEVELKFLAMEGISHLNLKVDIHANLANYFRLFLPTLLSNVKQVIYLDADIVVKGSLKPLWQVDLGGFALAAVASPNEQVAKNLIISAQEYINSGVMVMNLEYWRKQDVTKTSIQFLQENTDIVKYWDQDAINKVLNGRIKYIDPKWNDVRRKPSKTAVIRHFVGVHKPWSVHYPWNEDKALYFNYFLKTPFRSQLNNRWKYALLSKIYSLKF